MGAAQRRWSGCAPALVCVACFGWLGTCSTQSAQECLALGYPRNASDACRGWHGTGALASRAVHYVQRSGDLLTTLSFLAELGFRILRHEENERACPITCNGAYENPWSKTMVGTLTEDEAWALEITHNYGVSEYDTGPHRSLVNFGVVVAEPALTAQAVGGPGYFTAPLPPVAGMQAGWQDAALASTMLAIGPDDYYYTLMAPSEAKPPGLLPRFHHISLRVSSLQHSLLFYTELLGMQQLQDDVSDDARAVGVATACLLVGRPQDYADNVMSTAVGYADKNGADLIFVLIDDGFPVTRTEWGGRNAIAMPELAVRRINDILLEQQGEEAGTKATSGARIRGNIVHPLQVLEEKLGRLLILIVSDPDGNELCLVNREVFDPLARAADDFRSVRKTAQHSPPLWRA